MILGVVVFEIVGSLLKGFMESGSVVCSENGFYAIID